MIKIRSAYFFVQNFIPLKIDVLEDDSAVVGIHFLMEEKKHSEKAPSPLLKEAFNQLEEYFKGELRAFTFPVRFIKGTPFQKQVWNALRLIPYGEVVSYKQLAIFLGIPGGSRAIGMANHNNPIPIVIPCHRVIQASGGLGGYSPGVEWKIKLLEHEGIQLRKGKVQKPFYHITQEV